MQTTNTDCPVAFFFCTVSVWFWYQDNGGLVERVLELSFFSFLEEFEKDRY